ncbi:hypothetical protein TcG_04659 [Trypanosoma cruzi]|nr:hypothetical protein TcG_04659 [Trypanosoma cruzi]
MRPVWDPRWVQSHALLIFQTAASHFLVVLLLALVLEVSARSLLSLARVVLRLRFVSPSADRCEMTHCRFVPCSGPRCKLSNPQQQVADESTYSTVADLRRSLLSIGSSDFTVGMLRERESYARRITCRLLPSVVSSLVRSVRQFHQTWTVAMVALRIPDAACFAVLSMLASHRGILRSWLVIALYLFQFSFSHADNVSSRRGTTAGDSSSPIQSIKEDGTVITVR